MILFVSRNQQIGQSFVQDLEQEGFQVKWISDYGKVIPELFQYQSRYSMIILDMEANGNDATELCQTIKTHSQFKLKPLICMVKKDYVVEQLIAFELGADEFIYVPYTSTELQLRMRSIKRLLDLQKELENKENQLRALKQVQQILVTLSHYINNSLTPLYTLVQIMNEKNEEDARRLNVFARRTVEFINKVLRTLNELVQSGEMKVVKDGVYKNLLLDIEQELKKLQQEK
jgi:DNA-binding response OmpR family regulator